MKYVFLNAFVLVSRMPFVASAQQGDCVMYIRHSPLINGYAIVSTRPDTIYVEPPCHQPYGVDIYSKKEGVYSINRGIVWMSHVFNDSIFWVSVASGNSTVFYFG